MTKRSIKKQAEIEATSTVSDAKNPAFVFSMTDFELLTKIAKGEIDPVVLAKTELANRGLNDNNTWIGFKQARKFWGLK